MRFCIIYVVCHKARRFYRCDRYYVKFGYRNFSPPLSSTTSTQHRRVRRDFLSGMNPDTEDNPRWTDDTGLKTIQTIVCCCTPWTTGLTAAQLRLVSLILEGSDVLYVNATRSGKSCAFSIPIVVWNEYNTNPDLYPRGLRTFKKPVGLVITPTKGLAKNLVRALYVYLEYQLTDFLF
jgi:hypothetical protein